MKTLSTYINETKKIDSSIDFSKYDDEIEAVNNENSLKNIFKLKIWKDEEIEHLYIKSVKCSKVYNDNPEGFGVSIWDLYSLNRKAPELSKNIWIGVETHEVEDYGSKIKGIMQHIINPVMTKQGMLFNNEKECKKFVRDTKNVIKPNGYIKNGIVKRAKYQAMTLQQFIDTARDYEKYTSYNHGNMLSAYWEPEK